MSWRRADEIGDRSQEVRVFSGVHTHLPVVRYAIYVHTCKLRDIYTHSVYLTARSVRMQTDPPACKITRIYIIYICTYVYITVYIL